MIDFFVWPAFISNVIFNIDIIKIKLDYYRAQAAFCLVALLLMLFTNSMAVYSLAHHRYMYKRLTASLYVFTGTKSKKVIS